MDDEFRRQIRRFGLTEKETDTYLTILENGPETAAEIADEAGVSKRHVYTVAKQLEERHLVIVNDYFTPTTIEPAPPDEVYEHLSEQVNQVYSTLEAKYHSGNRATDTKVLKSRSTVVNKIEELIENAEDQLALSLPAVIVPTLRDSLRAAVDRGVLVLLLIFEDQNRRGSDPLADVTFDGIGHAIRYRDSNLPILVAVDDGSALASSRGVIAQPNSQVNAVFLGQPYMQTVVYSALVNTLWVNSEEIIVTEPHSLPHTYTNLRRAAIDAIIHEQRQEQLVAEIEARPTDQPEEVVNLVGEVSEVKQRLVDPTTDPRPRQCCLCIRTDDGVVTVGNHDAFFEDYRSYKTTLRRAE